MKSTDDASLNTTEIEPTTTTGEFCLRFFIILMVFCFPSEPNIPKGPKYENISTF